MPKSKDELKVRIIGEPDGTPENRKRYIDAVELVMDELDRLEREAAMKEQKTVLRDGK